MYLLDPDGHRIELFRSDDLTVDPAQPELTLLQSPSLLAVVPYRAGRIRTPVTPREVKIREGAHKDDDYLRVNPWGKIRRFALTIRC